MWKSFVLTLAGMAGFASAPAFACGDAVVLRPHVPPADEKKDNYVKKTVQVDVNGKLNVIYDRCGGAAASITVNGKTYRLQFASRQEALKQVQGLKDKTARVTGTLEGDTIQVSQIEAGSGESIQETVNVEIKGELSPKWLAVGDEAKRIDAIWMVTVDGVEYELDLGTSEALRKRAWELNGRPVVLTGRLDAVEDGLPLTDGIGRTHLRLKKVIRVSDLRAAVEVPVPC